MLFPSMNNNQLIQNANRLVRILSSLVDKAFSTSVIQKRIQQAREDLPDGSLLLATRAALKERGLDNGHYQFDSAYQGALRAASLSPTTEPIDCYAF